MQILNFSLASLFSAPFVLLLALFTLFASIPSLRGPSIMADVAFLDFYLVSGPVGLTGIAAAATTVWLSFRTGQGSRAQLYALIFYSVVLAAFVLYLAWWHGTSQKLDAP